MSVFENILVKKEGRIAYVTINREQQLNALNTKTIEELMLTLTDLASDIDVWGIIVTGSGAKAFVAGADIKEFQSLGEEEGRKLSQLGSVKLMDRIQYFEKPVIAAINGYALGGGLELALSCHLRVAVAEAKVGLPEVSLGLIPGYGGTQRLTELVGRGKALEMIMTGGMISADDANRWGLVNHVVAAHELISTCEEILHQIFSRSKTAVAAAIRAVNAHGDKQKNGYGVESEEFGKCFETPDFEEGVAAFLEKRKPRF